MDKIQGREISRRTIQIYSRRFYRLHPSLKVHLPFLRLHSYFRFLKLKKTPLVAHWECRNHHCDEKASCATVIVYYVTTLSASKGRSVIFKRCSLFYSRRHYVYWWGWQELKRSIRLIEAQREAPISTLLTCSQGTTCNHLPRVKYWIGFWLRCSDVKLVDGSLGTHWHSHLI